MSKRVKFYDESQQPSEASSNSINSKDLTSNNERLPNEEPRNDRWEKILILNSFCWNHVLILTN